MPTRTKTKMQIQKFLLNKRFASKRDFLQVRGLSEIDDLKTPDEYDENTGITVSDFLRWVDEGFGAGDMVIDKSGNLCLLDDGGNDKLKVCLMISNNTPRKTHDVWLNPSEVSIASLEDCEKLERAMQDMGLEFANPQLELTTKLIPMSGQPVGFINHKTGEKGIGVVHSISKDGDVFMYCFYLYSEASPHYSFNEKLGALYDFRFNKVYTYSKDFLKLVEALKGVGKVWNHQRKRIEPLDYRKEKGQPYWFINANFRVEEKQDFYNASDHTRFLSSNYFSSREEAEEMVAIIVSERLKKLAEPKVVG